MLTDLLKWSGKRSDQPLPGAVSAQKGEAPVVPSKALPKFLNVLAGKDAPVLLDFGPVLGSNVEFFGERLGCKLFIEDLVGDIDRHKKAGTMDVFAESMDKRFRHADASVDGILCWDSFDFLDKASVPALARQIVRLLKPGGVFMGFFCTSGVDTATFTKFEIVDDQTLRHRTHPGVGGARRALQNRDILRMFEGLTVSDSFLLKNNTREMLLRRP